MLLFNGTAECQKSNKWFKKGNRHEFYMFSKNQNLMDELENIEQYFVARGLDNIEINAAEVAQEKDITNEMLMYAFQEAEQCGMSGTIVRAPLAA